MNTDVLLALNHLAGHSMVFDAVVVFCAKYLVIITGVAALAAVGLTLWRRQWRAVVMVSCNLLVTILILGIVSHVFFEQRPFTTHQLVQLIPHTADNSFPSDHATGAMALALSVLVFTRYRWLGWILVGCAVVIGLARIVAGVHYPGDIGGGFAVALVGAGLVYLAGRLATRPDKLQTGT